MKRIDNVPIFDKSQERSLERNSTLHTSDYLDSRKVASTLERTKYAKSTPMVEFCKQRGREDNLVYKISEGFNLEEDDKTFFDVYNVKNYLQDSGAQSGMTTSKSKVFDKHYLEMALN